MNICSLSFLYVYLPLMIVVCLLTSYRYRSAMLLLCSLVLYYVYEGNNLWLLLFVVLSDWALAGMLYRSRNMGRRRIFVICSVVKNLGLIIVYGLFAAHIPLGLSVYCVTSMGYVLDCYNGFALWERNPVRTMLLSAFLPKLYAGPVVYYSRTASQFFTLRMTLAHIGEGGFLFLLGLCKKVIIGDSMRALYEQLHAIARYDISILGVWAMLFSLSLALYFSLLGLCEMAKGMALIFGFELPDNFDFPFCAKSINEFFGKFNFSVNRFIRRHVYMTLGGVQGSTLSAVSNILLLSVLMALWFGLRVNYVAWGLFLSLFVLVERYFTPGWWKSVPGMFRWLCCFLVIEISMVFFIGNNLSESFAYWRILFSSAPGVDDTAMYLLVSNYLVILLGILLASGVPAKVREKLKLHFPRISAVFETLLSAGMLLVATAYLL